MNQIDFMSIGGFKVGHAQDVDAGTGCTVFLPDTCAPAGLSIQGGGPASRETPLLNPLMAASGIHAILLSGGSAFGLDAAGGVMKFLEERNVGFDVGVTKVPLVCQSALFDLAVASVDIRPDAKMGYDACVNASYEAVEHGNVGAGTGCTIGKVLGPQFAMKSGLGTYALSADGIKVGALVAVNALGDVYEHGVQIAGLLAEPNYVSHDLDRQKAVDAAKVHIQRLFNQGLFTPDAAEKIMADAIAFEQKNAFSLQNSDFALLNATKNLFSVCTNTTLAIIVTNCSFCKADLNKIAAMAHDGMARAIRPVHTTADGDSVYAVSTGDVLADINVVGNLAAIVLEQAIVCAVKSAHSAYGFKGFKGLC